MRFSTDWKDYSLLDIGDGRRLERWGDYILSRPDPVAIAKQSFPELWNTADAVYHRATTGGGQWEYKKKLPLRWEIGYKDLRFIISPTGFKHTGLFPEQAVNWDFYREKLKGRPSAKVLNLFGYTGAATLACLSAGASLVHLDAAKGMVSWARENAEASGLSDKPCRWLIDDAARFLQREQRRGNRYDGIIMDPPSYGRGPSGEVWQLEKELAPLIQNATAILSDTPLFLVVNGYTAGISPAVSAMLLNRYCDRQGMQVTSDEIGLPVAGTGMVLPCGGSAIACWD